MIKLKYKGFTLIELLITVAIVAILGTIALPAYYDFVRESRRADAHSALSKLQLAQESFRANCRAYAASLDPDISTDDCSLVIDPVTGVITANNSKLSGQTTSRDGHYTLAISNADGNSYTLTATPTGIQADDDECAQIILTVDPDNPNGDKTSSPSGPDECWNE
jgi:type IV pilus assembly protein PilE